MEKVGWSPACHTLDPAVDLSGGPYEICTRSPAADRAGPEPPVVGPAGQARPGRDQGGQRRRPSWPRWLRKGVVHVAAPSSFSQAFLQSVTNMPYVRSQVNISSTFLELELSTVGAADGQRHRPARHRPRRRPPGPRQPGGRLRRHLDHAVVQPHLLADPGRPIPRPRPGPSTSRRRRPRRPCRRRAASSPPGPTSCRAPGSWRRPGTSGPATAPGPTSRGNRSRCAW